MVHQCLAMRTSLVMTLLGPDRPGLVELLSATIADNQGNWLESRMSHLSGQFAGILRIECDESAADQLAAKLRQLSADDLAVEVIVSSAGKPASRVEVEIDVVGNDRPGIVRSLAAVVAEAGGNVEDLTTRLESAPMAGHPLFHAKGRVSLPQGGDPAVLSTAIEGLGEDLSVTVS
jgi:glycine cleavage system regulatory protein